MTLNSGDNLSLSTVQAGHILGQAVNDLALTVGNTVTGTGNGDAITLVAGGKFVNNAGATALSTPAGRWLVYSTDPGLDTRGSLAYDFKQYNATYGVTPVLGSGKGFLYSLAPTITASLAGTAAKAYDGNTTATLTAANYSTTGQIDGDTITPAAAAASYLDKNVGTGKQVTATGLTIGASNGAATVYGYQLANSTAVGNIGKIDAKAVTLTAAPVSKTYDGTTSYTTQAADLTTLSAQLIAGDSVTAASLSYGNKNVGSNNKTVTLNSATVSDGNGGNNYSLTLVGNSTSSITPASLAVSGITANSKVFDGTTAATLSGTPGVTPIVGDHVTAGGVGVGAFADPNVGAAKPVTVSGFALAGPDAGNYNIVQPAGLTADITAVVPMPTPADPAVTPGTADASAGLMKFCFGDLGGFIGAPCRNEERRSTATALAVPVRIVDGGVRLPAGRLDSAN